MINFTDPLNTNYDSINIEILNLKVDSLSRLNNWHKTNESPLTELINHQWTLLSIQTAIFIGIIVIIITIAGFFSWNLYFKKLNKRIDSFNKKTEEIELAKSRISELENKLQNTSFNALRSLYEGANNLTMKVIWHIRYCELFYDTNNFPGLNFRMKKLKVEFEELFDDKQGFEKFKTFDNIDGILKILQKLIQSNDKEINKISAHILSNL